MCTTFACALACWKDDFAFIEMNNWRVVDIFGAKTPIQCHLFGVYVVPPHSPHEMATNSHRLSSCTCVSGTFSKQLKACNVCCAGYCNHFHFDQLAIFPVLIYGFFVVSKLISSSCYSIIPFIQPMIGYLSTWANPIYFSQHIRNKVTDFMLWSWISQLWNYANFQAEKCNNKGFLPTAAEEKTRNWQLYQLKWRGIEWLYSRSYFIGFSKGNVGVRMYVQLFPLIIRYIGMDCQRRSECWGRHTMITISKKSNCLFIQCDWRFRYARSPVCFLSVAFLLQNLSPINRGNDLVHEMESFPFFIYNLCLTMLWLFFLDFI